MSNIPTKHTEGDAAIGRNVAVGGNATVRGCMQVDHDVLVKGWLDAPNIKGVNKGVFRTEDRLNEVYPRPRDGWFAFVGDTLPAAVYIAERGIWRATGETGGEPNFDTTWHGEEIERQRMEIDELEAQSKVHDEKISNSEKEQKIQSEQIADLRSVAKTHEDSIRALELRQVAQGDQIDDLRSTTETHDGRIESLESIQSDHGGKISGILKEILLFIKRADLELRWFDSGHSIGLFTKSGEELAKVSNIARYTDLDEPKGNIEELRESIDCVSGNVASLGARMTQTVNSLDSKIINTENQVNAVSQRLDLITGKNATEVIDTIQEFEDFLVGITNRETLTGLLMNLAQNLRDEIQVIRADDIYKLFPNVIKGISYNNTPLEIWINNEKLVAEPDNSGCFELTVSKRITSIDNTDTGNPVGSSYIVDMRGVDTSGIVDMETMFLGCGHVEKLYLGGWDTSKVTCTAFMFKGCHKLRYLDVSGFDMSNVTDCEDMFYGCESLCYIKCSDAFYRWCHETRTVNGFDRVYDPETGDMIPMLDRMEWEIIN